MYAYRPSISAPLLVFPQLAAIAAEAGRLGEGGKRKEEREREGARWFRCAWRWAGVSSTLIFGFGSAMAAFPCRPPLSSFLPLRSMIKHPKPPMAGGTQSLTVIDMNEGMSG